MRVKKEDLRTNSDLRRMKGATTKDFERTIKYQIFYSEIKTFMEFKGLKEQN